MARIDYEQIDNALARAIASLQHQADELGLDYRAEFPSTDAELLRQARRVVAAAGEITYEDRQGRIRVGFHEEEDVSDLFTNETWS